MRAGTETAAIVPEIWSAKFYDVLLAELPFNESVSREYEGEIQNLGDIVNISSVPEFDEAQNIAEDQRNDAEAVTITGQQLTINKRFAKDFIVTKRSQLQSLPFMDQVRDKAIYSIMKAMQSQIITDTVPSAAAPDHQIAYDSGTTLALADMLEAKELLDAQNVPSMMRKSIVGSAQLNDLFNITSFNSKDFIPAGSPQSSGVFDTPLLGFDVRWTTEVGTTSYFFHPSYMTMAIQDQLSVSVYDLGVDGKRAARVNVDLLAGFKQLDDERVVTIS